MINLLIIFVVSFVLSTALMPAVKRVLTKLSVNQTILNYVTNHKDKNGTTTMGGVLFILSTLPLALIFIKFNWQWFTAYLVAAFLGVLGFMDDFLKIKYKQNLGLRPYQKIIGQFGIALVFAIFIFLTVGGKVFVPFTYKTIDLKFFVIPLVIFVVIACTNSVNLTDGLDALAGVVTIVYLVAFSIICALVSNKLYLAGETGQAITNLYNINQLNMLFIGAIMGFLFFNTSKASIFMGDVGSLCLGGYIASSACLVGQPLIIPILGFCFVFSAISVILQVAVFKLKHKRLFKMAPFHHHLQLSNLSEPKIVYLYSTITVITSVITIIFYLL